MNNKGLEALASLASADPGTEGAHAQSTDNRQQRRPSQPHDGTGMTAAGAQPAAGSAVVAAALNNPVAQNPASSLTAQQLQQLIAAAVGGGNPNPQLLARPNLNLLGGVQQQPPQQQQVNPSDQSTLLAMQQLAYFQFLKNAKQGVQNLAQTSGSIPQAAVLDPSKAASLLLQSAQLQQGQNRTGEFSCLRMLVSLVAVSIAGLPVTRRLANPMFPMARSSRLFFDSRLKFASLLFMPPMTYPR